MEALDSWQYHHTSVSLRRSSRRRLRAAQRIVQRNGIHWSESELLRRLAKIYLQMWRGRGGRSGTARRYNTPSGEKYVRVAWYVDKMLYAVLWERSVHSGESVSRMLDFAIRYYVPRLLEGALSNPYTRNKRAQRNFAFWDGRQRARSRFRPDLFITYSCETRENSLLGLDFRQEYRIIPKTGLSPAEILHLIRHAT